MFHICTWYQLFMFTTFLIDIIKHGKLQSLFKGHFFHTQREQLVLLASVP